MLVAEEQASQRSVLYSSPQPLLSASGRAPGSGEVRDAFGSITAVKQRAGGLAAPVGYTFPIIQDDVQGSLVVSCCL